MSRSSLPKDAPIAGYEADPARLYAFGRFRLDGRRRRLSRDGEVVPLAGKAFDTLLILVRSAGHVVEKDDLMKRVWPDTFVTDDSLTQNISVLRKALADTPDDPHFIVTVPRRGYRFAADVIAITEGEPGDAIPKPSGADPPAGSAVAPLEAAGIVERTADGGFPESHRLPQSVSLRPRLVAVTVVLAFVAGLWWFGTDGFSGRSARAGPPIQSLAVLPLENLSGDPGQEYVADGMTEALIARLGGLRNLRVVSRTSAMQFKGGRQSVPEISRSLAVDAVVTGSVQRSADRIRVTAHLIRSEPEAQLWSGTYDRDVRDVLALQSEVALIIARQVDIIVTGPESARLAATAPTVSPEVYDHYLKGRHYFNEYTQASLEQSITHFEAAIAGDPTFAPAYLGLATAYGSFGTITIGSAPPPDVLPKAIAAATRALELDPTLADAHVWLADAEQQQWKWAEAESRLRRALELNPSHARAHASLGWWLLYRGRTDEAIAESRRGRDLDPLAMDLGVSLAITFHMARRHDEAIRELHGILALEPDNATALMILGMALVEKARFEEAIAALDRAVSVSGRNPMILGTLAGACARGGQRARALEMVDELIALRKLRYVTPGAFAFAYVGLGDHERTFTWLERAYAERTVIMKFIKVNPMFDPVRTDPRFVDLVRRVGLG